MTQSPAEAALHQVSPPATAGSLCPYTEAVAALTKATALADAYSGADSQQVQFGMLMGAAQEWRELAQLRSSFPVTPGCAG